MKKIILLVLIIFGVWLYDPINVGMVSKNIESVNVIPAPSEDMKSVISHIYKFQCDGRKHCSQMGSYAEAKYFLDNCPRVLMDGDNDGIPCEKQFGQDISNP